MYSNTAQDIGQFVKGKIAELLFEMMMREDTSRTFTVIPFGYEKTTPELAQYRELIKNYDTLEVIKRSPDYILIKNDKTKVYFVEVKYRRRMSNINKRGLLESSQKVSQHWKDTWYFVATQDGFYFDSGKEVIKNNGKMMSLDEKIISPEIQKKYLAVLKEFIRVETKI
ncbi:MAG: hypothetical protein PHR98_04145 [Candidatus Shapirobacteria bacterium]|jgi:hypothetical protein|nr:hypothetical protein [Candidatus Shapirobacteria bacterium]